jgi:uncharacterized protein YndB with AHSA1/START domain
MLGANDIEVSVEERCIRITREFDAPRALVFRAWTEREHVGRWFGPDGFSTTTQSMDVRVGGHWRYVMHGPDGVDYANLITYREIDPPARLAYSHGADENDPGQFEVTVDFKDVGGKTRLHMTMEFVSAEARHQVVEEYGAIDGARQTMARLEAYLETMVA